MQVRPLSTAERAKRIVAQSVSKSFQNGCSLKKGVLEVEIGERGEENAALDAYCAAGDKLNKLLAIEPIRWLAKMPEVETVDLTINSGPKSRRVVFHRADVEKHLKVTLTDLVDIGGFINEKWQKQFAPKHDTKEGREKLARKFRARA